MDVNFLQYPLTTKNGDLTLVEAPTDDTLYRLWYLIDGQRDQLLFTDRNVVLTYLQGQLDQLDPQNDYQIQASSQGNTLNITISQTGTPVLSIVL